MNWPQNNSIFYFTVYTLSKFAVGKFNCMCARCTRSDLLRFQLIQTLNILLMSDEWIEVCDAEPDCFNTERNIIIL